MLPMGRTHLGHTRDDLGRALAVGQERSGGQDGEVEERREVDGGRPPHVRERERPQRPREVQHHHPRHRLERHVRQRRTLHAAISSHLWPQLPIGWPLHATSHKPDHAGGSPHGGIGVFLLL